MLQQTRWNRKETAEILGISHKALLYKMKKLGVDEKPIPMAPTGDASKLMALAAVGN